MTKTVNFSLGYVNGGILGTKILLTESIFLGKYSEERLQNQNLFWTGNNQF